MNVLEIERLGKLYRLGLVTRKTFNDDVKKLLYKLRGKEDPFAKIGVLNDRTVKSNEDYVWALRDLSYNVQHGDVVGIIGKNGAGKSTLLKLLSQVTAPTEGVIRIKGRVASLLEVGTGFHNELTGRENVFLNGAILGMTKSEVRSKFDEIVAFSGVEKYIDTPVKRYSSGMLVRLGFAVAAHLEPEILIVDEVLAVGDIEFQRKCLGKMQDVSSEGRTILFVSHNMKAVEGLCKKGIILENGRLAYTGSAEDSVKRYLKMESKHATYSMSWDESDAPGNEFACINSISIKSKDHEDHVELNDDIEIEVDYTMHYSTENRIDLSLEFFDDSGESLFKVGSGIFQDKSGTHQKGRHRISFEMNNPLNTGVYYITLRVNENRGAHALLRLDELLTFEVKSESEGDAFFQRKGLICPQFNMSRKEL